MDLADLEPELRKQAAQDPKGFLEFLARFFSGSSAAPSDPEELDSGKRNALCIGLNSVDPSRYFGWSGDLPSCENDAKSMRELLGSKGFRMVDTLLTKGATHEAVVKGIRDLATRSRHGDSSVIFFSGHGGQLRETGASIRVDEVDHLDETLVLYDQQITDDEIAILLASFDPGVRIAVVVDACHSGTVTKAGSGLEKNKVMPAHIAARLAPEIIDSQRVEANVGGALRKAGGVPTHVLLSACREEEVAYAGYPNSQLTAAILKAVTQGGDWQRLHANVIRQIRTDQNPVVLADGPAWREALRWEAFA